MEEKRFEVEVDADKLAEPQPVTPATTPKKKKTPVKSSWQTWLLVWVVAAILFVVAGIVALLYFFNGYQSNAQAPGEEGLFDLPWEDSRYVVALDAGHGGHDPGALSATGITEAEVNRQMLERVKTLLERNDGDIKIVETCAPEAFATPRERANAAADQEADLLLSLHLNADENSSVRGFQCFPLPPNGGDSPDGAHHEDSYYFAGILVRQVAENTGLTIRGTNGIYYAYYYGNNKRIWDSNDIDPENPPEGDTFGVVQHAQCPAILIEQWFITSPQDMALCYTEAGMDKMARSIYASICEYFGVTPHY